MKTNIPTHDSIRVSVSQNKKYMRCQKSWWYQYGPLGIKPPAKSAAKLGSQVHHILEEYQTNGTEPPDTKAGRIASCGLDKLPDPNGLEIERSITLPLSENSKILCRIDMLGKDRFYVGDHKTTSDFKWAKTRAELNTDVQLLTYAYAAYHEDKPAEVEAELIYYRTRGLPVSMAVSTVLKWDEIEANWEQMGKIAEEMAPKKSDPTGDTCTPNTAACNDFGGCFFASQCPSSPKNRVIWVVKVVTSDNNVSAAPTAPKPKKEKVKMKSSKEIQKLFGILSPDAEKPAPKPKADPIGLEAKFLRRKEKAQEVVKMIELFGGSVPGQTVMAFLQKSDIPENKYAAVIEAAGAELNAEGVVTMKSQTTEEAPKQNNAVEIFSPKRCTVDTLKLVAAELRKEIITAGGMAEMDVKKRFNQAIAPSTPTAKRWSKFLEFLELNTEGGWFEDDNPNGYTIDPDEKTGADLDREAYEAKTGKKAPAAPVAVEVGVGRNVIPRDMGDPVPYVAFTPEVEKAVTELQNIADARGRITGMEVADILRKNGIPKNDHEAVINRAELKYGSVTTPYFKPKDSKFAAIGGRFVVLVDALFGAHAPTHAVSFNKWVESYMLAVENLPAAQGRDFYTLDADYAKGSKLLCAVISAAFKKDTPSGLIVADSGNGIFRSVLPVLEQAGAIVIYGRR
jgi:CRISPR/Cas system-associated exonuclease Cas4 (RecB family)